MYTNSSGASSLAEDLYVPNDPPPPMAVGDDYMDMMEQSNARVLPLPGSVGDEYMDMMEQANARGHPLPGSVGRTSGSGLNSVASSCSITSGTPSTDLRFGEYQLDKVTSIFTPDEEETR